MQEAEKGEKPIGQLFKEKGISEATFYSWRKKLGGLQTRDVQRLRELEKENARLNRLGKIGQENGRISRVRWRYVRGPLTPTKKGERLRTIFSLS